MIDSLEELAISKILHQDNLKQTIAKWKAEGQKIVFTNGCFDLLHIGHISYLLKAASLGDKLVIGLNSDASVKRLKGPSRPINLEANRALILAAMFFVDAVIQFEEDTPLTLITNVLPDVLVKGGDYVIENIVGAAEVQANGGDVRVVSFIDGHSSTALIEKISSGN
ncbi:D-glycero-beta-D-manno-heptose 1-phosphate adenylyltransferase [Pedobacter sp. MC2016-14]|uniref:D-glycero-beta-D-manno-heptose 1-phosphate adenylyltransferase n=1 Tax=Pedobacter sp. MC2016-14 TaxID=2897327 RepID=UPI001E505E11|nr:D-glycero-beta-D-manno-heptose 1-phosphate adenylyltransferase [Pedobacter sp. MC2016-14]MCD0487102.1 D-glycero-beta-D-manno-heptose 1-phosphate adenylyltransferase [Pedobacter sp. MC2016-14]